MTEKIEEIIKYISDIRDGDRVSRHVALKKLCVIAKALGPDRTRKELIPYTMEVTNHTPKDLRTIAKRFGNFVDLIGGYQHSSILLEALRQLCENEDALIREPATHSVIIIGKNIPTKEYQPITQFAKDACEDPWYPMKCTGAEMCCALYDKFPDAVIAEINQELTALSLDQTVLVRRSLAKSLPLLIMSGKKAAQLATKLVLELAGDSSAAVSIELPKSIALIAQNAPEAALQASDKIYKSGIWQAKSVLISELHNIFKGKPPKPFLKNVVNTAATDQVNVVRASIARQIPFIYESDCLSFDDFQQFVNSLISDSESCVRLAVATALGKLPHTKKGNFDDTTIITLLNDEELDVRMEALSSVASSGKAISSASKNFTELIKFSNWRIKRNVADLLPKIAAIFDEKRFNSEIVPIIKSLLSDEASDARSKASTVLVDLVKRYGQKWEKAILHPIIKELFNSPDYQLRKTAIESVAAIASWDQFKDILNKIVGDPCPNVRLVLARNLPGTSPLLDKLKNDADPDVKELASAK